MSWAHEFVHSVIDHKDRERIEMLIKMLEEAEEAKQVLRDKGYGWTGLSLLKTVKEEVPRNPFT